MDMSMVILEVDGGISNPAVASAIVIWGTVALLAGITAGFAKTKNLRLSILGAIVVLTPIVPRLIANLQYSWGAEGTVIAHFWGFSRLVWLAPLIAVFSFAATSMVRSRRTAAVSQS